MTANVVPISHAAADDAGTPPAAGSSPVSPMGDIPSTTPPAAVCPTCGQPRPPEPTTRAAAATPMPKILVDLRGRVGAARVYWPGFDPAGDYTGDVTLPVDPVYAVKLAKVSVFGHRWGPGEYLGHDELLALAKTTVDRPAPVHPVSRAHNRPKRAADAPAAAPEGEGSPA